MKDWEDLPAYWMSLRLPDLFAVLHIFIMMLVIIVSNVLFASFIESKPAGRKTVIGNKDR